MIMRKFILIFIFTAFVQLVVGQNIRIGNWRAHHNYTEGIISVEVKNRIYTATENGLFYVDKTDNSITTWSKVNGFSDVDISTIAYDEKSDLLLIAYNNTLIDAVQANRIFSIPDILRKSIPGKKAINSIYFYGNYAYFSCSFGIVVYDIEKEEVKESYTEIDPNGTIEILETAIFNDSIFAATENGIIAASLNSLNLLDNKYWNYINVQSCKKIIPFNNMLYAELDGYIYRYQNGQWNMYIDSLQNTCSDINVCYENLVISFKSKVFEIDKSGQITIHQEGGARSALLDEEGNLWLSMPIFALIKKTGSNYGFYTPNGPSSKKTWNIEVIDDVAYVATGGLTFTGSPAYNYGGIYLFQNESWQNKNYMNNATFVDFKDMLNIAADPISDKVYFGTYGDGLAIYENGNFINRFDQNNSSLQVTISDTNRINIRGLCFDSDNNLWVSNFGADEPLSVRYADKSWASFSLGSEANRGIGELIVDDSKQKWILLPLEGGIIVFDENQQGGSTYKKLSTNQGNGGLPTERIHSIAKDLKGRIWLGSEEGVAIIYNPEDVFSGNNFDAQQIWINDGEESGYLLASEIISVITVDGANNKWIGSKNGAWYVSDDGTEIIHHFNKDNSPLPTSDIRDIAVNEKTGEVFFATDLGIVSYRNEATKGEDQFGNVYAFPNPVRPGYEGPIAIKGLVTNANVKITDIAGNVVTEMTAQGGQAVWDGKDISGNAVMSGVYLVLSSNDDGSETNITKILIVR